VVIRLHLKKTQVKIPVSTYRVQFNAGFRFTDALEIIDYLCQLGITDLYASPIFKARAGSTHGYDVTDPTQINPEIGTPEEFDQLCRALQDRGMGLLLDTVPNHMAASLENPWWFDVLEKGEESPYAGFFDVNWESKKVLLPILGRPYGEALDNQELQLQIVNGRPMLQYYEQKLPIAAGAENLSFDAVDRVLSRQHYRLAYWRKAADSINYRRFFDINDLVGLQTERDEVFQATHRYVFELVQQNKVTGLRIDHIDGLRDPKQYLDRLPDTYVLAEKILAGTEQIPCDWRVHGTTGYDFTNYVNGVFIDREGFNKLQKTYKTVTGSKNTLADVFRARKRQVMRELFAGEVQALVHRLVELAQADRHARDLQIETLREAFVSVIAHLPIYRTYIRDEQISGTDRAYIEDAIRGAGSGPEFDFLRRVLLIEPAWYLQRCKPDYLDFVMRWQQFTGPVMAKGLEDTTFYVYNPLVSVNDVGGDCSAPDVYFGVEQFHRRNAARRSLTPHTMNTTSTHDTKRSEDVRARINVLSELPDEWAAALGRWMRMNPSETAPDASEQVLIYQTMLGAWPIEVDRLKQYVTKALREAKTNTSWIDIDEDYERSVFAFVEQLYDSNQFIEDFGRFQEKVSHFGALSSLSQVVLKITSPGVPDIYRGTEIWDLSVADPDNRRPVDFASRKEMFEKLQHGVQLNDLVENWSDGRLKMYVTWKLLKFRRDLSDLFQQGEYIPLHAGGARADHIVAFARRLHDKWCIVAVPRLYASLGEAGWGDTQIETPQDGPATWQHVLTGDAVRSPLRAAELFRHLPVATLLRLSDVR
jgi:(1->4)-alpha-D-glucan 1-alpha-D-glucosylmutase